jgi:hypothetical protein
MHTDRLIKITVLTIILMLFAAAIAPWHSSAAQLPQKPIGARNPDRMFASAPPPVTVPGGPKFLMVNPFQFRPAFPSGTSDYFNGELNNPGPEGTFYEAALTLPENVRITKMVVYFYDNNDQDLLVGLWRIDPTTGAWQALAETASFGTSDEYRNVSDTSIINPLIDQQRYSYLVEVGIPPAFNMLRLVAVRIDYTTKGDQQ